MKQAIGRIAAYLIGLLILCAAPAALAEAGERRVIPLDQGWRFHLGAESIPPTGRQVDDSRWSTVSLPHNWNRMGGTSRRGPEYQNVYGPGWYRLSFSAPALTADEMAWLQFDGASIVTDVWLNGVHLGRHEGAFGRFRFDAGAALRPGGRNLLAVRVDNSKPDAPDSPTRHIIPISGDFPIYGGLYRTVSLIVTRRVHVAMQDYGGPGFYLATRSATPERASISMLARLRNDGDAAAATSVTTEIVDAEGHVVAIDRAPLRVAPEQGAEFRRTLSIPRPHLWNGVADPYLYRARLSLHDAHGVLLDRVEQPLGIRTFRIDPDRGFFLNGRHVDLHGVSRHQDRPVRGWAISDADIDQDFALMKAIGANTVRLAHYQHAQEAYRQADQAGMAVWAEIPLVDRSAPPGEVETPPAFAANAERQLRELIRQNYNHPSIITWSIANEVNLMAANGKGASHARPLLERLQRVVHEEDPGRPATLADCCGSVPSEAREGLDTVAGITDVIGYNRYFGWYSSDVSALGPELDRLHRLYPDQPISISEYGAGGALSQHSDDPLGGPIAAFGRPHPEEFQNYILEQSWRQIRARPFIWSNWVWNMFDFSNEIRLEGDLVDTNDKGLMTFDRRIRKDAFYFFKANWSREPFVYITGRRYVDRAYPVTDIKVYSNQPAVTLSLNGRNLGDRPCAMGICLWKKVSLVHGANRIAARASGQAVDDAVNWQFANRPGVYRIRAGTLSQAHDRTGALWGSDAFFTGGEAHFRDVPSTSRGGAPGPVHEVAGTRDQTPYESWRDGNFSYALALPDGRYRVTLHFFEPQADQARGRRLFDVAAEGRTMLSSFDIMNQAGGAMRAVAKEISVTVQDGELDLAFRARKGQALVSGIEVAPAS